MQKTQKSKNNIKKSHLLLLGSLLIFVGIVTFSWRYLVKMKEEVFSDMKIAMMDVDVNEEIIHNIPIVENIKETKEEKETETKEDITLEGEEPNQYYIDYDKYLGVLEIPKIGLKRGFYNSDYDNLNLNVCMVKGSSLPDVDMGNLILISHSGNGYGAYFAYLYRLDIGDDAYVTYNKQKYNYKIVNIYTVPKKGVVSIVRNFSKTTLTLITCTKNDDTSQTVYIAELV